MLNFDAIGSKALGQEPTAVNTVVVYQLPWHRQPSEPVRLPVGMAVYEQLPFVLAPDIIIESISELGFKFNEPVRVPVGLAYLNLYPYISFGRPIESTQGLFYPLYRQGNPAISAPNYWQGRKTIVVPTNIYVAEDGITPYVAEDGVTDYVQE